MLDWLVASVLGFVGQYGYVAVFVYMVLETSFLVHFVPSEVVVPFAASRLVHDGSSFALFVADTTAGATVGSLLAYTLFGQFGRGVFQRYGHVLHVSDARLEQSQRLFLRYGESSVFWGRLFPFLRALISIPAGVAGMDRRKFVLYSAVGAAIFNTALTYLVYTGASTNSPFDLAVGAVRSWELAEVGYVLTHETLVIVLGGVLVLLAAALWQGRRWIATNPELAKGIALHSVRALGVLVGALFVLGALASPHQAFAAITWAWNDPLFFVQLGVSEAVALLLTGALIALLGGVAFEVGQLVRVAHVRSALSAVRDRRSR